MRTVPYKEPGTSRRAGYVGLAIASLAFALSFLPAPLAVLYEMNDQSLRAATMGARSATWDTLHRVPPTPMPRHVYLAPRAVVIASVAMAVFLLVAALVAFRSRAWAVRLHTFYVAVQVVLMAALWVTAARFTAAMEAGAASRDWMLKLGSETSVYSLAKAVAGFGMLYPLVLMILYLRLGRLERGRR